MPQSHKGGGAYDCVAPCDHITKISLKGAKSNETQIFLWLTAEHQTVQTRRILPWCV